MQTRIVHIDSGKEWRGAQRQLYLLAREQRARGFEPLVIGQRGSRLMHLLQDAGVGTAAVRMRGSWDLAAARRIRILVRNWSANIVHAHDERSVALALAALMGRPGTPLVITRRTPTVGRLSLVDSASRISRYVATSSEVARSLRDASIDRSRISVVCPGVITDQAIPRRNWPKECRWSDDTVVCGVMGASTNARQYQLEKIVSGMTPAARERIGIVVFGVVDPGPRTVDGVKAFGAGFVDEVGPAIAGLDVLWHLSGLESMGTAVIDAMALRVPPVAFGLSTFAEFIESDSNGVLVPPGDTVAFAAAASSLVENDALRRTIAAHGPGRAARFSVRAMVDAMERVYEIVASDAESTGRGTRTA